MLQTAHRFSRSLVFPEHTFKLSLEISKATEAIYEGIVFENGEAIQRITAGPEDNADSMKNKLLREAYDIAGKVAEGADLGDWTFEELNLDGSPAVR
jgi:hypothetical protein